MKVSNMTSDKGNPIANQFEIQGEGGDVYFQSYNSIIVKVEGGTGKTYLDINKWDYSKTTGKYRNQFLGESKKETQEKINSGIYKLIDLNSGKEY